MSLEICYGPMFAGKSTRNLRKLTTLADIGWNCLYINHADDKRKTEAQDKNVTTHHSQFSKVSPKITAISTKKLSEVNIKGYRAIFVDEGQFFDDITVIRDWVWESNKTVFISALDGDAKVSTFGRVYELIPLASRVIKLRAYCVHCRDHKRKKLAPFTAKLVPDNVQKDVGGTDKYIPLCLRCYKKHQEKFVK